MAVNKLIKCAHWFEAKERGLVCKYCGYTLHLIKISKGQTSAANGQNTPVKI